MPSCIWAGLTTLPSHGHIDCYQFWLLHGQALAIFMAIFHLYSFCCCEPNKLASRKVNGYHGRRSRCNVPAKFQKSCFPRYSIILKISKPLNSEKNPNTTDRHCNFKETCPAGEKRTRQKSNFCSSYFGFCFCFGLVSVSQLVPNEDSGGQVVGAK